MNQVDKISKEALQLLQYAKDVAVENLSNANNNGKIQPKLDNEQLVTVFNLLGSSLSQGYLRGLTAFQKAVKDQLVVSLNEASNLKKK